jgi:hypothetical protein
MPSYEKNIFYQDNKVYGAGVMAGGCLSQCFFVDEALFSYVLIKSLFLKTRTVDV